GRLCAQRQGPQRQDHGGVRGRRCRNGIARRCEGCRSGLLVGILLSRANGADELRGQGSGGGQSAEIWTGTQFGALAANIISGILKTTPDKIKVNQQMLGGGYGRRIWPDAAIQATILSNITKKPVKLILTREDDVAAARPRPMTHHVLKAGLDA